MFILSGGEPLLRNDLATIAAFCVQRGATVVVGTNGTLLTEERILELAQSGVTGFAVSVDSLGQRYHDRFRRGLGALDATTAAIGELRRQQIDFIIQTTITKGNLSEIESVCDWAAARGATSFNAYFPVHTGRAEHLFVLSPEQHEQALTRLVELHQRYLGVMLVRAKCAPHYMRHLHSHSAASGSPTLAYETRCPCGLQYCRITPDGKLTPCPYNPTVAGDLRQESFASVWESSPVFAALRNPTLEGKCARCEFRQVCGGCRARALAQEGDVLASDPSCVYQPQADAALVEPPVSVTYGTEVRRELSWSPEARARVDRIPSFVRGVVIDRVETYARRLGLGEVNEDLLTEVRRNMPVDFSKRLPFFAQKSDHAKSSS
jgi:radical SAM protein with 4Fe4S-binding SPASM domain